MSLDQARQKPGSWNLYRFFFFGSRSQAQHCTSVSCEPKDVSSGVAGHNWCLLTISIFLCQQSWQTETKQGNQKPCCFQLSGTIITQCHGTSGSLAPFILPDSRCWLPATEQSPKQPILNIIFIQKVERMIMAMLLLCLQKLRLMA